ncbi:LSMD1 acetyltransferase, partial [Polyodon spathula]|nr:LSMD1 acetyltransferase [Polyodon spathula]
MLILHDPFARSRSGCIVSGSAMLSLQAPFGKVERLSGAPNRREVVNFKDNAKRAALDTCFCSAREKATCTAITKLLPLIRSAAFACGRSRLGVTRDPCGFRSKRCASSASLCVVARPILQQEQQQKTLSQKETLSLSCTALSWGHARSLTRSLQTLQDRLVQSDGEFCSQATLKLENLLNKSMRIHMTDGRTLVGLFLCSDRDCNVILGSAQEFLKPTDSFSQGEPRILGLAMIPGHHVVSIEVESDSLLPSQYL